MTVRIDLDSREWTFREALGQTWLWYVSDEPPQAGNNVADAVVATQNVRGWMPATVPGSVIGDLVRLGELPDPYHARNSLSAEWTKERYWVYRRLVELPEIAAGEFVTLELDGVDPAAEIHWDGVRLGRVEGLHHRHRIRIDDVLATPGPHLLTVALEPAPPSEPQVGFTNRVTKAVPRMGYGWDFCPRLIHQGIWKSARLIIGAVQLESVTVRPEVGNATRIHIRAEASGSNQVTVEAIVTDPDGLEVGRANGAAGELLTVPVPDARLWWPAGMGEQSLYGVTVTVRDGDQSDERRITTGLRSLVLAPNPGSPPGALGYTLVVNGVPIPATGWNMVATDALYGEIDSAKVSHLLDLVAVAGGRLLRLNGVSPIESEHFFSACDERGILVWQEFTQSSSGPQSVPSEDPAYVSHLCDEARRIIPTRVHHPSLAIWGGGNELGSNENPLADEDSPVLLALRDIVTELDPGRPWLGTSPTGPLFGNTLKFTPEMFARQHDVHGPWEHQGLTLQHTLYNQGQSLAHTEFGVEGMTNKRSLEHLIPADHRWPADRSNPVYRHTGAWWINAPLVQESFGHRLRDVEQLRRASQLMQADGLRYAVEADRRRSPRMSMVLPWQLNEPVPNAWGTFAVDFYGSPKPVYDSLSRAFADIRVTLQTASSVWPTEKPAVTAWVWSHLFDVPAGSFVELFAYDIDGTLLAHNTAEIPNSVRHPTPVTSLVLPERRSGMFVWRARWRAVDGSALDDDRMLASWDSDFSSLLDLHPSVEVEINEVGVTVANTGSVALVNPRLTDTRTITAKGWPQIISDNRILLPNEERHFEVTWPDGAEPGPLTFETFHPCADHLIGVLP